MPKQNLPMFGILIIPLVAMTLCATAGNVAALPKNDLQSASSNTWPDVWNKPPAPCAGTRYRFGALRNCGYEYEGIFVDGKWHNGPIYFRYSDGQRWYWWQGGWRRDERPWRANIWPKPGR
jgi:hypothetical protein